MIDIYNMSIIELHTFCNLQVSILDLQYILSKNNSYKDLLKRFGTLDDSEVKNRKIIEYLIENEEYVDKDKLILINLQTYRSVEKKLNSIKIVPNNNNQIIKELGFIADDVRQYIRNSEICAEQLRGKDINFVKKEAKKGKDKERYVLGVVSCKELLNEPMSKEEKRREKTTKRMLKSLSKDALSIALIQATYTNTDEGIATIPNLAYFVFEAASYNSLIDRGVSEDQINDMIIKEKFADCALNNFMGMTHSNIKEAFKGVEKYIDGDKLCLNSFMNIVKDMDMGINTDNEKLKEESRIYYSIVEKFLPEYYSLIAEKQVEVKIGDKIYTTEDAKNAMKRFIDGKYMSDFAIQDQMDSILTGKESVEDVNKKQLQYIRKHIINTRGIKTLEELTQMVETNLLTNQDVISLYMGKQISLEDIRKIKGKTNLEECMTPKDVVEQCLQKNDKENKDIRNRYIELYKEIYCNGKTEEEITKSCEHLLQGVENCTQRDDNQKITENVQEELLDLGLLPENIFAILTSRGIIESDVFINMYKKGKVGIDTIREVKKQGVNFDNLDIDKYLIDGYMQTRQEDTPNLLELNRLILLYKELKLKDIDRDTRNDIADEFMMKIGEQIEKQHKKDNKTEGFSKKDRKKLYELGIIPIDTVVFWGENNEIMDLLKSEIIVPKDIRRLYNDQRITYNDIKEIIKSPSMKLEQKIALINIVFPSRKDSSIREDLFEEIELSRSVNGKETKGTKAKDMNTAFGSTNRQGTSERYIFDTAVRYNAFTNSDDDVKIEVLDDGHVVAHLPNVRGGLVVIEKMYSLKKGKDGKRSMEDAYGAKAFILTEEEYIENKEKFITTENQVIRSELRKVVQGLTNLEEKGIIREISHFKNRYPEQMQELLGVPSELRRAKTENQKVKALKELKDSEQYSDAEKMRIEEAFKAWEDVKDSREIYGG